MKTPAQKIDNIVTALGAYDTVNQIPAIVRATVEAMDEGSIGCLHGITGVFCHAVHAKMPGKWLRQIHGDLLDAFCCLANIAHETRAA